MHRILRNRIRFGTAHAKPRIVSCGTGYDRDCTRTTHDAAGSPNRQRHPKIRWLYDQCVIPYVRDTYLYPDGYVKHDNGMYFK
eukprot:5213077-Ditylum_brightwellii.AAC.1